MVLQRSQCIDFVWGGLDEMGTRVVIQYKEIIENRQMEGLFK